MKTFNPHLRCALQVLAVSLMPLTTACICCSERLSNFHVDYLDAQGNVMVSQDYPGQAGHPGTGEERHDDRHAERRHRDTATVSVQQNRPRVDGLRIIGTAAAKDGHTHMLDQVREPRWARRTVLDVITADERLTVLERILLAA